MNSIVFYKILSIPDKSLFSNDKDNIDGQIKNHFRSLISEIFIQSRCDRSCIRIAFSSDGKDQSLNIYIVCINCDLNTHKQIESFLFSLNYEFVKLNEDESNSVAENINRILSDEIIAVVKSEQMIFTPYAYTQYYYYTDTIKVTNNSVLDDYSSIISGIDRCPESVVCIDLIPTNYLSNEAFALQELMTSLEQIKQGYFYAGQMMRDPSAEKPLDCYKNFNTHSSNGLFKYNLLVASKNQGQAMSLASQLASLIQSSCDDSVKLELLRVQEERIKALSFVDFPFIINEILLKNYRNQNIWRLVVPPTNLFRLPFLVTAEEASVFFRLPYNNENISAIKTNYRKRSYEALKSEVTNSNNVSLGTLTENHNTMIGVTDKALTQHMMIVGTPGFGKTTFAINLLLQFYDRGIPFLAIEPTKTEYRSLIDRIDNLQIFTPGNNEVCPFIINPFIPPKGIRIEQYIPALFNAFTSAFDMEPPLDMLFKESIRACYTLNGWKDYSKYGDEDVSIFGLHDFVIVFKSKMSEKTYDTRVRNNIESAGVLRLMSIIEQNSNIYDNINTIPIEDLLTKPTVLELNAIGSDTDKSLLMAFILVNTCLYTQFNSPKNGKLQNAVLIDEAHVLLSDDGANNSQSGVSQSKNKTKDTLQKMIAEIRSYGTSMILADQTPSNFGNNIRANTNVKVAFHLVEYSEKRLIADSINLSESDFNNLSRIKEGEAYVHYDKMALPHLITTNDIRAEKNIRLNVLDDEIRDRMHYWDDKMALLRPFSKCNLCRKCQSDCDFKLRANAEYLASVCLERYRKQLTTKENVKKIIRHFDRLMEKELVRQTRFDIERLLFCSQLRLWRKTQTALSLDLQISVEEFIDRIR